MVINLIAAVDMKTNGIGYKGTMPWEDNADMQWFKKLTVGNACIMGWATFTTLKRPLKDRLNIVISHISDATTYFTDADNSNVRNARNIDEAIQIAEAEKYTNIFVIGGSSIYKQYLERDLIDTLYIDYIDNSDKELKFDTYFPFDYMWKPNKEDWPVEGNYFGWIKTSLGDSNNKKNNYIAYYRDRAVLNDADSQYLALLKEIKETGITKHTRSGDTLSLFGKQLRFNVFYNQVPILTTKKVFVKSSLTELLWFFKGGTNIKYLIENNCHIWDDDAYRYYNTLIKENNLDIPQVSKDEFLAAVLAEKIIDFNDLHYTYGDLGPVYGKQWIDWNGINQLDNLINMLKTNPDDRRLLISSWNVGELKDMALPPCHYMSQWYTKKLSNIERENYKFITGKECPEYGLSVMWSQRSVDTCLGLPYDLLNFSVFLYMVAQCVGMVPYEVICSLGDVHIYKNQLDSAEQQIIRNPYKFDLPNIELNPNIKNIYDFTFNDIKITNYNSYPAIKYILNVGQ